MVAERTLLVEGHEVSEILFRPDDGWPLCYGYMVGPDDGKSGLYVTPQEAVANFKAKPGAGEEGK